MKNNPFSTPKEAFAWIESFYNAEKTGVYDSSVYKLDRMQQLLLDFNSPQNSIASIHIAGSKGKGSTASLTASILTQAGYRCGLYSSPHLVDYRERITLNGEFFSDVSYCNVINFIQKGLKTTPTVFELLTLTAFLLFKEENCDVMVIETGLGGRLDATNTLTPQLSIITRIEKEHTQYLGKQLKQIAYEKGGIIKEGKAVLIAPQKRVVRKRLMQIAHLRNSNLIFPTKEWSWVNQKGKRDSFRLKIHRQKQGIKEVIETTLPAPGPFQSINSIVAISAAELYMKIQNNQFDSEPLLTIFSNGIARAKMKGRLEKIASLPSIYIDGAHTPISLKQCCKTFNNITQRTTKKGSMSTTYRILIFSAVEGKNIKKMITPLHHYFDYIIITSAGSFRKSNPQQLYQEVNKKMKNCLLISNIEEALIHAKNHAKQYDGSILVAGSFFLAGEIVKITSFKQDSKNP